MESTYLSSPAKRPMPDPNSYLNGPSKRSKPVQSPLLVPAGHVLLRMICHVSRVGGIIGKSGSVIKQLQQSTGAKIRIEDAPADCPDRVVSIVAESNKIAVTGGQGSSEELRGLEISSAQDALVKVFERILEVAAESDGVGVGMGIIACRLLADLSQVGSVLRKGGKIVEKLRIDAGCKIRVLTENLPACSGPTDAVIEIEGDTPAIKRGLVAVSGRLQDCQPTEKKKLNISKPLETIQQEFLPDPRMNLLSHWKPVQHKIPSSDASFSARVHSLSLTSDRNPTMETKTSQKEVIFKILCSNDMVGGVIGKGGSIIKALQNETGAIISIGPSMDNCDERLITVTALENPELRYSAAQNAVMLVFSRFAEAGSVNEQEPRLGSKAGLPIVARVVVPSSQVGSLLGKGGSTISEMRQLTGAGLHVLGRDQVPICAGDTDQVVEISGEFLKVRDALYQVTGRMRDRMFSSTLSVAGNRSSSSTLTETSPFERLVASPSPGLHIPVGASHSLSQHHSRGYHRSVDVSPYLRQHNPLSHSFDNLSTNFDRPPTSRLWTSQTIGEVNSRAITDVGRGLPPIKDGLEFNSGRKSAIVTNTTLEIVVPEELIGAVYGENGVNIARLKEISGAKVTIHEPRLGTSDRVIVISGTPNQTQAAQSLLQAFILTGSS